MSHREQTIRAFLSRIASENVTPAGGTGVAVVGAIGASLCEMACVHTLADDDSDGSRSDIVDARDELATQRQHLLDLADRDSDVVDDLFVSAGDGSLETERKRSVGVPLTIAAACLTVVEQGVVVAERGKRTTAPDAETGVYLARSALRASGFIVRTNVDRISDRSFVERVTRRAATLEASAERAFERTTFGGADG